MRTQGRWVLLVALVGLPVSACSSAGTDSAATTPVVTTSAATTSAPTPTTRTDPFANLPLIDHVSWVTTSQGKQLQVFPSREGRIDPFPAAQQRAWEEVLADDSTADTPGMHDQFQCHWEYARIVDANKTSWNLEPWRPVVGYQATVGAQCNPGGAEE